MNLLMEQTEKHIYVDELQAEAKIEELKEDESFTLMDYKLTTKETKESIFYILTVKKRFATLSEAKEKLGL